MEVERKFLITSLPPTSEIRFKIIQCYLESDTGPEIRIRLCGSRSTIGIKFEVSYISRKEFEYQIPLSDAHELMDLVSNVPPIEKIRYIHEYQGFIWEVDIYQGLNYGLCIAEIELNSSSQNFIRPPWLGKEITKDKKYYNVNLYKNPYRTWA